MTTDGTMTLPEFWDHVADVQADYRARGVVSVYFKHDTLTPGNVRTAWHDHPIADVPEVGTVLDLPGFGYMGADGAFRVVDVEWLSGPGVVVTVADAGAAR